MSTALRAGGVICSQGENMWFHQDIIRWAYGAGERRGGFASRKLARFCWISFLFYLRMTGKYNSTCSMFIELSLSAQTNYIRADVAIAAVLYIHSPIFLCFLLTCFLMGLWISHQLGRGVEHLLSSLLEVVGRREKCLKARPKSLRKYFGKRFS